MESRKERECRMTLNAFEYIAKLDARKARKLYQMDKINELRELIEKLTDEEKIEEISRLSFLLNKQAPAPDLPGTTS